MKIQIIQRRSDGQYWVMGVDCADRWTRDPLSATRVGDYVWLSDAIDGLFYSEGRGVATAFKALGYDIVEFEITATATGRTLDDLYVEGKALSEWERDQCGLGLHSWVGKPEITDPEAECERPHCNEKYGYV